MECTDLTERHQNGTMRVNKIQKKLPTAEASLLLQHLPLQYSDRFIVQIQNFEGNDN